MNLTIDRSTLLTALTAIAGIVPRKSTAAILSHVLIDAGADGRVTFRGSNLDIEATVTVEASVIEAGATTVPAGMLLDVARNAADGAEITMGTTATRLAVKSGRSKFNLPILPVDDFPALGGDTWDAEFSLSGAVLADLMTRPAFAATRDMSFPQMSGVNLAVKGGELRAVGLDGKRMCIVKIAAPDCPDFAVTVPLPTCAEIAKMVDGADAHIGVSSGKLSVTVGDARIVSKLIGSPFVDYRAMSERLDGNPHRATLDRQSLIAAVKRVMAVGDGNAVKLAFSDDGVLISTRATDADAEDQLEAEIDGDRETIAADGPKLLECLASLRGDKVQIAYQNIKVPLRISSPGDDDVLVNLATRVA